MIKCNVTACVLAGELCDALGWILLNLTSKWEIETLN